MGNNALFLDPGCCNLPTEYGKVKRWNQKLNNEQALVSVALNKAIDDKFGGNKGFGDWQTALTHFGVSANHPIYLVRQDVYPDPEHLTASAATLKPYIYVYDEFFNKKQETHAWRLTHEMAHYWDQANNLQLNQQMLGIGEELGWVNWGDKTGKQGEENNEEDFATAVAWYFWPEYDERRSWTDDMGRGLGWVGTTGPDQLKMPESELKKLDLSMRQIDLRNGTIQVKDRYDFLECKFGKVWKQGESCNEITK